jgi:hypothetical protein
MSFPDEYLLLRRGELYLMRRRGVDRWECRPLGPPGGPAPSLPGRLLDGYRRLLGTVAGRPDGDRAAGVGSPITDFRAGPGPRPSAGSPADGDGGHMPC